MKPALWILLGAAIAAGIMFLVHSPGPDYESRIKAITASKDSITALYWAQVDCTSVAKGDKVRAEIRLQEQMDDYAKLQEKYDKIRAGVRALSTSDGISFLKSWASDSIPGQ